MRTHSFQLAIIAFLGLASAALPLHSQTTVDLTQHVGIDPYGSYSGSNIDHIDMMSGNLSAQIPLFTLPQKGKLALGYRLALNNNGWSLQSTCDEYGCTNWWMRTTVMGPALVPNEDPYVSSYALLWTVDYQPECTWDDADQIWICTYPASNPWSAIMGYNLVDTDGATHALIEDANNAATLRSYDGSEYLYKPDFNRPFDLYAGETTESMTYPPPANTAYVTYTLNGFGDNGGRASGVVTTPAGISYCNPPGSPTNDPNPCGNSSSTEVISDTNGNKITVTPSWPTGDNFESQTQPSVVVDSVGRTFTAPPSPVSNTTGCPSITDPGNSSPTIPDASSTWTVPGPNGSVTYLICYETVQLNTNFDFDSITGTENSDPVCPDGYGPGDDAGWGPMSCNANYQWSGSVQAIQSIGLIPNGSSTPLTTFWGFSYNPPTADNSGDSGQYGDISQIVLPTGGSIQYTYLAQNPSQMIGNRYIASRTMVPASGTGESTATWNYSWSQALIWDYINVPQNSSITGPDGTVSAYSFNYTGSVLSSPSSETVTTTGPQGETETTTTSYHLIGIPNPQPAVNFPLDSPMYWDPGSSPWAGVYSAVESLPATVTASISSNGGSYSTTSTYTYDSSGYPAMPPTCSLSTYYSYYGPPAGGGFPPGWTSDPCASIGNTTAAAPDTPIPMGSRNHTVVTGTSGNTLQNIFTLYLWQSNPTYYQANLMTLPSEQESISGQNIAAMTGYTYDESAYNAGGIGNLTTVTQTNLQGLPWPVTHYHYNSQGYLDETEEPNGNPITVSGFDCSSGTASPPMSLGVPTYQQSTTSDGLTSYTWRDCSTGAVLESEDPNNQVTYTANDAVGNPLSIHYPDGGVTTFNYNNYATPFVISTQVAPHAASYTYKDGFGRTIKTLAPLPSGAEVDTTYDSMGRVASVSNPYNNTSDPTYGITSFSYDGLGRMTKQVDSDRTGTQTWTYIGPTVTYNDENSTANGNNNPWQRTYDEMGRLTKVVEPGSFNTTYQYDVLSNLLCADQWGTGAPGTPCASSHPRSFTYDMLSQLLTATNPETGTVSYTYGADGNVLTKTDARGITVSYSYDQLNRLIHKCASDSSFSYNYYYDWTTSNFSGVTNSLGRLSYATNNVNAAEVYSYDPMGRSKQEWYWTPQIPNWNITVTASYDLAGDLVSLAYPDTRVVGQSFDTAGRLSGVNYSSWQGNSVGTSYLTVSAYDPAGHVTSATMGNGTAIAAGFNNRLEVASLVYGPSSSPTWSRQFAWQPNANLQQTADPMYGTRQYGYDGLNRLISAQGGGLSEVYSYDAFGNLQKAGSPFNFQPPGGYNAANQPLPNADWSFDAAGNLTQDTVQGVSYTWNGEEKLSSANGINYSYDPNGD